MGCHMLEPNLSRDKHIKIVMIKSIIGISNYDLLKLIEHKLPELEYKIINKWCPLWVQNNFYVWQLGSITRYNANFSYKMMYFYLIEDMFSRYRFTLRDYIYNYWLNLIFLRRLKICIVISLI